MRPLLSLIRFWRVVRSELASGIVGEFLIVGQPGWDEPTRAFLPPGSTTTSARRLRECWGKNGDLLTKCSESPILLDRSFAIKLKCADMLSVAREQATKEALLT